MIEHSDPYQLAHFTEPAGDLEVFTRWFRLSGRMVMNEYERACKIRDRRPKHLPRMDQ